MSPFLSSTGPTASLSSNLASNKTSSVNQLINRSSNCCGRSLIRPVLSAVWVAASPQCLPLVYITIHFVRSCLLYKGGYRKVRRPTGGWGHPPLRRVTIDFVGAAVPSGPSITGAPPWSPSSVMAAPCHLLPCGAKALAVPSGALKCRWRSPHPSRLAPCHLPPVEGFGDGGTDCHVGALPLLAMTVRGDGRIPPFGAFPPSCQILQNVL